MLLGNHLLEVAEMSFNRRCIFLHALILISIFDASALTVGGVSIRAAWMLAPFAIIFLGSKQITSTEIAFLFFFSFAHLASSLYNSYYAGFLYILWIFFNFFIFYRVAGSKKFCLQVDVPKIFVVSGRLQIIIGAILIFIFQGERLSFTYYEPSYMAVGLIPFMVFSLLNNKIQVIDMLCISLFVALGQSALFVILLLIVLSVRLFQNTGAYKILLTASFLLAAIAIFVIDSYVNESRANHVLIKTIIDDGVDFFVFLDRGGNRFPRMEAAYDVFSKNILLGVGPGNYSNYISSVDFSYITRGIPWLEVHNQPPVNIFLEAGVNAGILPAFIMLVVFSRFAFLSYFLCNDRRYFMIIILVFVAGFLETSYLRAYCWLFFGVVAGHAANFKKTFRLPPIALIRSDGMVGARKRIGQDIA